MEKPYIYERVLSLLQKTIVDIVFVKLNGEERWLRGTLIPSLIPKTPKNKRKGNKHLIKVYDLDSQEWRSVRIESIEAIEELYPIHA